MLDSHRSREITPLPWYRRSIPWRAKVADWPQAALDALRWRVTRSPRLISLGWLAAAVVIALTAPDLTRLAAEGQAKLLPKDIESRTAGGWVARAWPEYAYESLASAALVRSGELTPEDHAYARRLEKRLAGENPPANVLRVLGPSSRKEIAERLKSEDGTVELVLVQFNTSLVVPATHKSVALLMDRAKDPELERPAGLELLWSGDAVVGGDYMRNVQKSLDRSAIATVFLLFVVLVAVYRSVWLALVPLITIGTSLVISRGALGFLAARGWELSPLVELFLVAVLFGSGTDFCLFVSWRFAEHWNPVNPAASMRLTLRRAIVALLTSAGTVIVSLSLMGVNQFRLFSSTGPSVALGLVITLAATLSLTPALLVLLAKYKPSAFRGITAPPAGAWDKIAATVLKKPALYWCATIAIMVPLVALGSRTEFLQDLFAELPSDTESLANLRRVSEKFDPGALAPLTVVIKADRDLRDSEGLALIDDVSRYLAHQRSIRSVRSATQPLGSPEPLKPARISERIGAVRDGFNEMTDGAKKLNQGLSEGAVKLRALLLMERLAAGKSGTGIGGLRGVSPTVKSIAASLLPGAGTIAMLAGGSNPSPPAQPTPEKVEKPAEKAEDPRSRMLDQLIQAADGALKIAQGAERAQRELSLILKDKVGERALDRLLVRSDTLAENADLRESLKAYISPDGRLARLDATQDRRIFSTEAMADVETLRKRLNEFLSEYEGIRAEAKLTGSNAGASDVQKLTTADQRRAWVIVPIAVLLVLAMALKDFGACVNLVGTMILTYGFALGLTHLVFVTGLGASGLDWKVPYFLFVLLVAVGVDYNVFLMTRLQEESELHGLKIGTRRAIGQTGGLITSAAAITACSFAAFMLSPLSSLRQLGFALVVGITIDAVLVRPILVPCGHWLMKNLFRKPTASPDETETDDDIESGEPYQETELVGLAR